MPASAEACVTPDGPATATGTALSVEIPFPNWTVCWCPGTTSRRPAAHT